MEARLQQDLRLTSCSAVYESLDGACKHTDYLPLNQLGKVSVLWIHPMKRQTHMLSNTARQITAFGQEAKATNASCTE